MRASFSSFFFFFLGAGLLMSFHGDSYPSITIICIQPQAWGASGRGRGNEASRFFFFFLATGMVPPWDLVPYANCGGTDFVHDIIHIAQTPPPQLLVLFLICMLLSMKVSVSYSKYVKCVLSPCVHIPFLHILPHFIHPLHLILQSSAIICVCERVRVRKWARANRNNAGQAS